MERPRIEESGILPSETIDLREKIDKIFSLRNPDGLTVNVSSYGFPIIWIAIGVLGFAFLLYLLAWFTTNDTIFVLTGVGFAIGPSVSFEELSDIMVLSNFWLGYVLLSLPIGIYLLSFWTYMHILYDGRLAATATALSKRHAGEENVRTHWDQLVKSYWDEIYDDVIIFNELVKAATRDSSADKQKGIRFPNSLLLALRKRYILWKCTLIKSRSMTNIVRKISIRIDGTTLSGFFSALILMEVVVAACFLLPTLEFARLGQIGSNLVQAPLATFSGNIVDSRSYLSFWAIEWAVFGAFVYSFISLMERVPRKDVTPRYYLIIAIRYMFAVGLSSLFFLIPQSDLIVTPGSEDGMALANSQDMRLGFLAALSFTIGIFPNIFFRKLVAFVGSRFRMSFSREIPLEDLTGISASEATRLWEEGISNVDQLADSSVGDLYRKTRIAPAHLQAIIGRALLWKHVIGIEQMMAIIQKEQKEKSSHRDKPIFRFADIQSLLGYFSLLDSNGDIASSTAIANPTDTKFRNWSQSLGIIEPVLRQVVARTPYYARLLEPPRLSDEVDNVLQEEIHEIESRIHW